MKKQIGIAIFVVFLGAIALVTTSILFFMPTKGPFATEDRVAIEQAGTEINLAQAPIWRLCSLPEVGRKTAKNIRQSQTLD